MRAGHVGGAQRRCRVAACRRRTWRHLKLEHQGHGSYAHFLPAPRRGTASRMRVSPCPARGLTKEVHELPPAPSRPRDRGNPARCGRNDSLRGATSILSESHFHSAPSADLAPRAARHGRPSLPIHFHPLSGASSVRTGQCRLAHLSAHEPSRPFLAVSHISRTLLVCLLLRPLSTDAVNPPSATLPQPRRRPSPPSAPDRKSVV